MVTIVAALISASCVAASLYRLRCAMAPSALDLTLILGALRGEQGRKKLPYISKAISEAPDGEWESSLFSAFAGPGVLGRDPKQHMTEGRDPKQQRDKDARVAKVNEQLLELDFSVQRWARVPAVCARVATSSGLLLAALVLRAGLDQALDYGGTLRDAAVGVAIAHTINALSLGVSGALFCVAVERTARKAVKERVETADKLVERLEALHASEG